MKTPTPIFDFDGPSKADDVAPFVTMALAGVHRIYPNQMALRLQGPEDLVAPPVRTPAFYGCFDWHSAVHSHWVLARAARLFPDAPFAAASREALRQSLTPAHIETECAHLEGRPSFERPYGLAWLLLLHHELGHDPTTQGHAQTLRPLVQMARNHLATWLPKLSHPTRSGTHAQTAFAMGLLLTWAQGQDVTFADLLAERAHAFFGRDHNYPWHLEPSGEDFLSPSLGAATLMARVLSREDFREWWHRVAPQDGSLDLAPVIARDKEDGRLVHLDGLNLSRAWMLAELAHALGETPDGLPLKRLASAHALAGLQGARTPHYAGSHWLGTFALYLQTGAYRTDG